MEKGGGACVSALPSTFETRSAADIRDGPWIYARHPTTRILCLSFLLPGQDPAHPSLWAPGRPDSENYYGPDGTYTLERLFQWIRDGGLVEAHNVMFERAIWHHIFTKPKREPTGAWDDPAALDPPWVSAGEGAPPIKDTQFRCSAAKCAALALPRSLSDAGRALKLAQLKDEEGSRLMKLISKPRRALKKEPKVDAEGNPIIYWRRYVADEFTRLYSYCSDDVSAEHAISESVPDLTEQEYQIWLADFRANWRGVMVDLDLVDAAIEMDRKVKAELNEELRLITGIDSGTKRYDILEWLEQHGLKLPDSSAPTLDWVMAQDDFKARPDDDSVKRVVIIARNINRTSVTKYVRVRACADPDDHRVRDLVMYHGATTGRWSGKGIQVQNFPRGVIGDLTGMKPYDEDHNPNGWTMQMVVDDIKSGHLEWCRAIYGDLLALLSSAIRGVLIPTYGMQFYVADYSAIEARVVLWVAGADAALDVFYRGDDIYCDMASSIYGRPITKKDKDERQFGKVVILGLGYGMGFLTFLLSMRGYNIHFTAKKAREIMGTKADKYVDWVKAWLWPQEPVRTEEDDVEWKKVIKQYKDRLSASKREKARLVEKREDPESIIEEMALCKYVVDAYRARYPEVQQLWRDQEAAACRAVELWVKEKERCYADPALPDFEIKRVRCGKVVWYVEDNKLHCVLPSGRSLIYNEPHIKYSVTPWGMTRPELRFMGVHKKSKKWGEMGTYGGSIVENIVQGTARDMMATSLAKVSQLYYEQQAQYIPLTTIHDELLAEAPLDYGDVGEFEHLLTDLPVEYSGCPVAAEGARLSRYQK